MGRGTSTKRSCSWRPTSARNTFSSAMASRARPARRRCARTIPPARSGSHQRALSALQPRLAATLLAGVLPEQKVMIRDFAWHEQQRISLLTETLVTRVDTEERRRLPEQGRSTALRRAAGGDGRLGQSSCKRRARRARGRSTISSRSTTPRRSSPGRSRARRPSSLAAASSPTRWPRASTCGA